MSNSISFGTRLLQCLERFYFAWALRYLAAYTQKKKMRKCQTSSLPMWLKAAIIQIMYL